MEEQSKDIFWDLRSGEDRGHSFPDLFAVPPMPPTRPCKEEKAPPPEESTDSHIQAGNVSGTERRESKMSYTSDKADFLRESEYVGQVMNLVGAISHATSQQVLNQNAQMLRGLLQRALAERVARKDLITMEQSLAQGVYMCNWADEKSGGTDRLLQQRISILQSAYESFSASF